MQVTCPDRHGLLADIVRALKVRFCAVWVSMLLAFWSCAWLHSEPQAGLALPFKPCLLVRRLAAPSFPPNPQSLQELPLEITTAAITTRRDHICVDTFQASVHCICQRKPSLCMCMWWCGMHVHFLLSARV